MTQTSLAVRGSRTFVFPAAFGPGILTGSVVGGVGSPVSLGSDAVTSLPPAVGQQPRRDGGVCAAPRLRDLGDKTGKKNLSKLYLGSSG